MSQEKPVAIKVAEEQAEGSDRILTLSTGVRVRYLSLNPSVMTDALAHVPIPKPPDVWIENRERYEPNPMDPTYLASMDNYRTMRGQVMMETFVLLGIELVDGLPEDDGWLRRLKLLERLGRIDLSVFDLDSDLDLKFLYLKNVAMGPEDWGAVFSALNVTPEGIAQAEGTFRRDKIRE